MRIKEIMSSMNGEFLKVIEKNEGLVDSVVEILGADNVAAATYDEDNNILFIDMNEDADKRNVEILTMLFNGEDGNLKLEIDSLAEHGEAIAYLKEALDLDEEVAEFLVESGFKTIQDISVISKYKSDLLDYMDGDMINALGEIAEKALTNVRLEVEGNSFDSISDLNSESILLLKESGITDVEGVAELCNDELIEILPYMGSDEANAIIMLARTQLNWI